MGTQKKHLIIIAGEASGDTRAGKLVNAIKALSSEITFSGVGGDCMQEAGVELFDNITSLAVIGIAEVLKNLGRIKKVFDRILSEVDKQKPDAVVLVDYPGFNLRLAAQLKKRFASGEQNRTVKVIYYISPQVWAWREKRIKQIKTVVDRMIVLFVFEKDLYALYGMNVDYVGHPLVDEIKIEQSPADVLQSVGLQTGRVTIGLMPGSRQKEIERHLPVMLEAAQKLYNLDHRRQFLLLKAPTINKDSLKRYIQTSLPIKIYEGTPYDGINAMDAAIVASGTATLETALLNKPMVIIYKTSWLTYAIAKAVVKIPYIGLVNVVAGRKIVDELIQNEANAEQIASSINTLLKDQTRQQLLKVELAKIKTSLGAPGASRRAAEIILEEI
ncbi:MAG: lipid-A-disaccharide synthase [Candidatus Omnitrophica bacterium]|nr:lipid-A-disaccharide synthase [Candidatus Omnitrophota bacterium]